MAIEPAILNAVSAILGPDILVRNGDVFVKLSGRVEELSWHQDSAQPDVSGMVTVWIALTNATRDNGCVAFVRGSHMANISRPTSKYNLQLPKAGVESLENADIVFNELPPGQFSLHHFHTIHRSGMNHTGAPRIGYAVRYMSPKTSPSAAETGEAFVARGDAHGRFAERPHFPVTWNYGIGEKTPATE